MQSLPMFRTRLLLSTQTTALRCFSNAKKKERAQAFAQRQKKIYQQIDEDAHDFGHLLRSLFKRSHPDLLRHAHPDLAAINDQSIQILNGILSTIKDPNSYPPQMIKDIPLHVRFPPQNHIEEHVLKIRTGGGDCKKHLTEIFQNFFVETKISPDGKFIWGKDYFPKQHAAEVEEELRNAYQNMDKNENNTPN